MAPGAVNGSSNAHHTYAVNGNGHGQNGSSSRTFELEEHPIDAVRPIKVGIIGSGLAGITAGILLPAKVPGLDLRIFEKNSDVVRNGKYSCYSPVTRLTFLREGRGSKTLIQVRWIKGASVAQFHAKAVLS